MTSNQTYVLSAPASARRPRRPCAAEGFDGRVVLIGAEHERPYERPPLSKDYLRGEAGRETIYVHGEGFYAEHDIELHRRAVTSLNTSANELRLDDGERLRYDRLLLATGAEPRRLEIPGSELDGVLYLRSVEDSDALRERLDRGGHVVIIGAGWIGAEVAASARQRGLEVTVLDPLGSRCSACSATRSAESTVISTPTTACRCCSAPPSRRSKERHPRSGSAPATVASWNAISSSSASASQPCVELAARAGIAIDNGILVDEHLQTSAPGVFAAGDVANALHPFYGERVRVEHWANALHQGPVAAGAMLGRSDVMTACRTSSPTSTRSGWSIRASLAPGIAWCCAVTRPAASSSLSGWRAIGSSPA